MLGKMDGCAGWEWHCFEYTRRRGEAGSAAYIMPTRGAGILADTRGDRRCAEAAGVGEDSVRWPCETQDNERVSRRTNHLKANAAAPIATLIRPFQRFAALEAGGGILLLLCSLAALWWANSQWAPLYIALWHTPATITVGSFTLGRDLHFLVNDGLMAVFFFVVGLEIKRELLVGELASFKQASLPIVGAIGGVIVPALIYTSLNGNGAGARGWGVPMATDIAFVIGFMALLGERVPVGLKVFLTALAIVDDIAAVVVIASFYTAEVSWPGVGAAAFFVALLVLASRLGVRHPLPYALLGIAVWLAVLQSGIHATIAGVVVALTIPSRTVLDAQQFLRQGRRILEHFEHCADQEKGLMKDVEQQVAINALEDTCEKAQPPLYILETSLHPWVTFVIMPVFALANAGVVLAAGIGQTLADPVALGVAVGLFLGKPLGIGLAAWLAVVTGLAALPAGVTWRHIHGAAWLGGIGFTMSLFVAALAFPEEGMLASAKVGVLLGSGLAAIVGTSVLLRSGSGGGEGSAGISD